MNWKLKKFFCNILAFGGFTRTRRRQIRDRLMFYDFIKETNVPNVVKPSVPAKSKNKINVAFCSDKCGINLAAVTIKSLLNVSAGKCDYNIYCVVDEDVGAKEKTSYIPRIMVVTRQTNRVMVKS